MELGKQYLDTQLGDLVTLVALDVWKGVQMAAVQNDNIPNPCNIPGLNHYWMKASLLSTQG